MEGKRYLYMREMWKILKHPRQGQCTNLLAGHTKSTKYSREIFYFIRLTKCLPAFISRKSRASDVAVAQDMFTVSDSIIISSDIPSDMVNTFCRLRKGTP